MDEGRKRVIGIMAAILAARKLAQLETHRRVPATISAIDEAISWAEQIMDSIDRRFPPLKPTEVQRARNQDVQDFRTTGR